MPPAFTKSVPVPQVAQNLILQDFIDRGRSIINQGLEIRRDLNSPTVPEFINLIEGRKRDRKIDRRTLKENFKRLATLHGVVSLWTGKSTTFVQSFKEDAFTPRLLTNWGATIDEMVKLREFTTPAIAAERVETISDAFLDEIIKRAEALIEGGGNLIQRGTSPTTLLLIFGALAAAVALIFLLRFGR